MQTNTTKKVYIINDLKSSRIEQVIFILKPGETPDSERDLGFEAQEIINRYSNKIESGIKGSVAFVSEKRKKHNPLFKFLPIAASAIFMFLVLKSFFC